MDDIFTVLAEPIRREILVRLRNLAPADVSVGELVSTLGHSQPTVSKHLKVLRDTGLVVVREEGQHRFYRLNPEPLATVEGWIVGMNDRTEPVPAKPVIESTLLDGVDVRGIGRTLGRVVAAVFPPPRAPGSESR